MSNSNTQNNVYLPFWAMFDPLLFSTDAMKYSGGENPHNYFDPYVFHRLEAIDVDKYHSKVEFYIHKGALFNSVFFHYFDDDRNPIEFQKIVDQPEFCRRHPEKDYAFIKQGVIDEV